ncbi:heme peroxidase family protein [Microlunatus capsulatus]|uniref:Animal haem peroxidase n=1 Tax=Microlunatus capsulatus TaxID=99117 RepID=A0ABS4Z8H2_9ACTN|nr:heme peroxidase family protein [Microlunatus capsulatus]MBP2417348.1 hypothetical protein [Microlunatus capsulatus]
MSSRAHTATCPFTGRTAAPAAVGEDRPRGAATAPGGPAVRRRTVLAAAAAGLLAGGLRSGPLGAVRAAAAVRRARRGTHGQGLRGLDIATRVGRDREARFGLMFKKLPAYSPSDALLRTLARRMDDGKAPLSDVRFSDTACDTSMPAGYIYLGQFADHDITLDKTPLTLQEQDPRGTTNFDSPRFDLGSVYGAGPAASPELYDPARPGYLRVEHHDGLVDLPRDAVGKAFLGDPRNDENLIVAQLHTVFLRLHNRLRDSGLGFEQARQEVRFRYQWLIVHDFLPRVVGQGVVDAILARRADGTLTARTTFYKPRSTAKPYMPVEFSGAAYRYGHSMIRAEYEVQDQHTVPLFARDGYEDLRGSRPVPHDLWVDWNYFFDIPGLSTPDDRNMARRIDTQISLPLSTLPPTVVAPAAGAILALAERNLLRGKRLGLPCGQDVATAMGLKPLTNAQLGGLPEAGWGKKAPLWYYVLKEAELGGGQRLGPVGGRIVAEVFLGLLALDPTSYFTLRPRFDPGAGYAFGALVLEADAFDPRGRPQPEPAEEPDLPEDPELPEEGEPLEGLEPVALEPDEVIQPEAVLPLPGEV